MMLTRQPLAVAACLHLESAPDHRPQHDTVRSGWEQDENQPVHNKCCVCMQGVPQSPSEQAAAGTQLTGLNSQHQPRECSRQAVSAGRTSAAHCVSVRHTLFLTHCFYHILGIERFWAHGYGSLSVIAYTGLLTLSCEQ